MQFKMSPLTGPEVYTHVILKCSYMLVPIEFIALSHIVMELLLMFFSPDDEEEGGGGGGGGTVQTVELEFDIKKYIQR